MVMVMLQQQKGPGATWRRRTRWRRRQFREGVEEDGGYAEGGGGDRDGVSDSGGSARVLEGGDLAATTLTVVVVLSETGGR